MVTTLRHTKDINVGGRVDRKELNNNGDPKIYKIWGAGQGRKEIGYE